MFGDVILEMRGPLGVHASNSRGARCSLLGACLESLSREKLPGEEDVLIKKGRLNPKLKARQKPTTQNNPHRQGELPLPAIKKPNLRQEPSNFKEPGNQK